MKNKSAIEPGRISHLKKKARSALRFGRFFLQNYPMMAYVRYLKRNPHINGKISIITATYNRPKSLQEAIESVRAQSYENWEQIVVSDGYDDRVIALVEEFRDSRVRCYSTYRLPVMGNYQRNYALKYATGEFVLYLDDDNIIYPHCLETMVRGFSSDEIGYVVCAIKYGEGMKNPKSHFCYREIDLLNYMVRRRLVENFWGQSVHGVADFLLIDKVARISRGNFLNEVIGHHR